jgi:hypothetical protein
MTDDLGAALTGGQVDPAEATKGWDDWLQRPGNRTALLQIGLNLMQPTAIGQTTAGHFGQAIGAGGEAQARVAAQDLKEEQVDNKLDIANRRLQIAQQQADANTSRANTAATRATEKKVGGLTDLVKSRFAREDSRSFEKQLADDAKQIVKQANDVLADPNSEVVQKYKGKTVDQIREDLRKTRKKPQYGAVPSNEDTSDDDSTDTPASSASTPPVEGARQAQDGNWYVPDPKRPGKYLRVNQ